MASRYAHALLRFAAEGSNEELVYAEMQQLHHAFQSLSALTTALSNPVLDAERKVHLLLAATTVAEGQPVSAPTQRFLTLVVQKGRATFLPFMATAFLTAYERERGTTRAQLVVATPVSEAVQQRLLRLVEQHSGRKVSMTTTVDPELLGGYILEYDDLRMDASLRGQFAKLRRALT